MPEISATVPTPFIEVINERLAAFTRRCEKKSLPVPVLTIGPAEMRLACNLNHQHDAACPRSEWTTVIIAGDTPRIGPWSLVASIDDLDGKPFFRPVPGSIVPEDFRDTDPQACDYCHARRYRTETFIVHNSDTDAYAQVGRQCIRDFLGWDISTLTSYFGRFGSLLSDPEGGFGSYVQPRFRPSDIIMAAANVVAVDGVYHRADANDSTKGIVFDILLPPMGGRDVKWYSDLLDRYLSMPEKAQAIFDATMTALETLDTTSDWAYNITTAVKVEMVGLRQVGILASAVILGLRAIEEAATRREGVSEFIGSIGERIDITAEIRDFNTFQGYYGTTTIVTLMHENHNIVKWFASSGGFPAVGTTVRLTGTVKKHDEYKGTRQTIVTRCKLVPVR
jgi:hypothetical protein